MPNEFNLKPSADGLNYLDAKQLKQVRALYNRAYKYAQAEAKKCSKKTNVSSIIREQELKKLQTKLGKAWENTSEQLKMQISGNMEITIKSVMDDNMEFMKKFGFGIEGAFSDLSDDIIKSIATGQVYAGDWTLSKALWKDIEKKQSDINIVIAQGLAENKSAYEIAKGLEMYVNPSAKKPWDWGKVYPGTGKVIDYNAQRLARTMVSHAYQQALVRTVEKNPFVKKIVWQSALIHGRTCDLCRERHGQPFDKDKLPMDHPNGLCTYTTITDSAEDIAERLADWAYGKSDPELDAYAQDLLAKDLGINLKDIPKKAPKNFVERDFEKNGFKMTPSEIDAMVDKAKMYGKDLSNMSDNQIQEQISYCLEWYKKDGTCAKELYYWLKIKGVQFDDSGKVISFGNKAANKIKEEVQKNLSKVLKEQKIKKESIKSLDEFREIYREGLRANGDRWNSNVVRELTEQFDNYSKEVLKKTEINAIKKYTGSHYSAINRFLRGIDEVPQGTIKSLADKCKKALDKTVLDRDMFVRRGSDYHSLAGMLGDVSVSQIAEMSDDKLQSFVGSLLCDDGFMSATPLADGGFYTSGVEYIIKLPKGTKALYVDSISQHKGEMETIIQAGTRFKLNAIEKGQALKGGSSDILVYLEAIV